MLKETCARSLCSKVTTQTVAKLLLQAEVHHIAELKTTCLDYIRDHVAEVMATDDWNHIHQIVAVAFRQLTLKDQKIDSPF